MNAVCGYPGDGSAFERERPANRECILHPFRRVVRTMGEQTVVTHANAEASRNPPEQGCRDQRLPSEEEQSGYGAEVQESQNDGREPDNRLPEGLVISQHAHSSPERSVAGLPTMGALIW